jgi:NAD(P)-dependent dehydrogenase (short-subunit alcohol dehydrogenase family)
VVNDIGLDPDGGGRPLAERVVADILAEGGRAVANLDSVAEQPQRIVQAAIDAFGRVDIVINNAGISRPKPFGETTLDEIREHLDVHFFGTAGVTLAAWPHLVTSGAGRVVNTASPVIYGIPDAVAYVSAKAAIVGFTRSLAIDGERFGVKVNAIAPVAGTRAAVESASTPDDIKTLLRERMPAALVSPVVAYLAHEDCAVSGETLLVAGGRVCRVPRGQTEGFTDAGLTPEAVAARLAEALDPASLRVVERLEVLRP